MEYAENIDFTKEELEYFNQMIEESEEMQRQNGNKTYSEEEVMENIEKMDKEIEKRIKKIQGNRKEIADNPEEAKKIIENISEEVFMEMLKEGESDYNKN